MSLSRLRIGQPVRPADDGLTEELGRIALRLEQAERDRHTSPYLVRWESGGESRCERSSIRPLGEHAGSDDSARRRHRP